MAAPAAPSAGGDPGGAAQSSGGTEETGGGGPPAEALHHAAHALRELREELVSRADEPGFPELPEGGEDLRRVALRAVDELLLRDAMLDADTAPSGAPRRHPAKLRLCLLNPGGKGLFVRHLEEGPVMHGRFLAAIKLMVDENADGLCP